MTADYTDFADWDSENLRDLRAPWANFDSGLPSGQTSES
jgi:hypothetical protein